MDISLTSIFEVVLQQGIWVELYIYMFFRMFPSTKLWKRNIGVIVLADSSETVVV